MRILRDEFSDLAVLETNRALQATFIRNLNLPAANR